MNKGLYIHIPFCEKICPYCAFAHVLSSIKKQDEYIKRLTEDIDKYHGEFFSSIYIGGGTPSVLTSFQLEKLFKSLVPLLNKNTSFTIEVNPSSLSLEKIRLFKKYHINRISLGIESFDLEIQNKLNRISKYVDIKNLLSLIHKEGIHDINLDLIYGVENESIATLKNDLDLFTSLDITHISCYCLQIEEHTIFYMQNVKEMNQDEASDQYTLICSYLKDKGFIHYEVSNFAKPNYESKHNLLYWRNQEYVGLGISASGYENHVRYTRENSLTRYLKHQENTSLEIINKDDEEEYYIILKLRLAEGINLKEFKRLFNADFLIKYKDQIEKLNKYNYLQINNETISVKEDYFFILNVILLEFIR